MKIVSKGRERDFIYYYFYPTYSLSLKANIWKQRLVLVAKSIKQKSRFLNDM